MPRRRFWGALRRWGIFLLCSEHPAPLSQEAAKEHSAVVALYRSHLLYAIQVTLWGRSGLVSVSCRGKGEGTPASGSVEGRGVETWRQEHPGLLSHPRARWTKTCRGS